MPSRGNFFGPAQGVQDVVSGVAAQRQAEAFGPGQVLDGLLKLRLNEQQAAQELFRTLSQTNPELVGSIIADKPEALKALIKTPSTLKQTGEVDPADQIVDAFTFAYKNMPAESLALDLTGVQISEIMQDGLEKLNPEALKNPEAIKTYFVYRAGKDVDTRAQAGAALQSAGFIKDEIRGIAGEADALAKWLSANGRPTDPGQAFDLLNNQELRDQLLLIQTSLARQQKERGERPDPYLITSIQRAINSDNRRVSQIEEEIATLEGLDSTTLSEDLSEEGRALAESIFGGGTDMAAAIEARKKERERLLKAIRANEELLTKDGRVNTAPTGEEKSAEDLYQEILTGN